jgi:hypothetical protein
MSTKELVEKLREDEDAYLEPGGFQDYELPDDQHVDPCPFCGVKEDELQFAQLIRTKCDAGWWYHVECVDCVARGPGVLEHKPYEGGPPPVVVPRSVSDKEVAVTEAILHWNTRRHTNFLPN